ncbi:YjbH domain-containing protein [Amylibacter sp. SFDW26]|uniref:YjbH domain-containing protein n=1 Tax=Amylibacter sp. SFDW26 TaxID=2652722 RepID=UPI001262332B|nr:YjbH domain-containing protein [Amylibacter sp. SFDW26]KAB7610096.1 YjbH domain-containing protein [Amylibacter sp. SFDW26]
MANKQTRVVATGLTALLSLGLITHTAYGQQRTFTPSYETAPTPIKRHNPNDTDSSWLNDADIDKTARKYLNKALRPDGLRVEALHLQATQAELRFRNNRYNVTPQAFGRAARAMANVLPNSVSTFVLTPVVDGLPVSSVTFNRSDLEAYENHPNGTKLSFSNAVISDPVLKTRDLKFDEKLYPKFTWSLGPYVELNHDDLTGSNQYSVRARANADWHISPGFSLSGSVTKELFGNISTNTPSTSTLQHVRSDRGLYIEQGDPAVEKLKLDYLFKATPSVYGRLSAGYLERAFGGVSGELLWKPAAQSWGLGAEVNRVKQRDFGNVFSFQDYEVTSGHISAYKEFKGGLSTQIDVGRYLAGDYGTTLSFDKRFTNGWSAGVFATKSNARVDEDTKTGFRVTIPLNWIMKTPSRANYDIAFGSSGADAGSRLRVDNRLYGKVREYHSTELDDSWARFWR